MKLRLSFVILAVLALAVGCGGKKKGNPNGNGGDCANGSDFDGDGYGVGCEAGPDCNDADANYNVDCCFDGNEFAGCPCSGGEPRACFDGDPSLAGVGACTEGTRTCLETNTWSACEGGVAPRGEFCDNGADNDCDGDADEGVLNACGNCMAGCDTSSVGDGTPFPTEDDDPNVNQNGTGLNPDGDIVLDAGQIETYFMWIANDGDGTAANRGGTVTKIDTRTGREVARYPSVVKDARLIAGNCGPSGAADCNAAAVPDYDDNDGTDADNRPSRTAIDAFGDCWVANRAHSNGSHQATITKFYNDTGAEVVALTEDITTAVSGCRDRNGDGIIQTSRDLNDDGVISTAPAAGEFFADDECVAATVMIGTLGGNARGLAIDAGGFDVDFGGPDPSNPGNAWVGMFGDQVFYRVTLKFNGLQPEATATRVPETGTLPDTHEPYGAAIDSNGVLWAVDRYDNRVRVVGIRTDAADFGDPVQTYVDSMGGLDYHQGPSGSENYGIVVDLDDKIWIAGWDTDVVNRYDPATGVWTTFTTGRTMRGMAIDLNGYVWSASSDGGNVIRIPANAVDNTNVLTYDVDAATGTSANGPVGVGVDFDGQVWLINRSTSNASKLAIDVAQDLDGDGIVGDPVGVTVGDKTGNLSATVHPVGPTPYTYSDFTGLSLRAVTRPSGSYSIAMQGCPGGTEADWQGLVFDAEVPLNTEVQVFVQVGNDLATLEGQPFFGPWTESPMDLDMPAPMSGQQAPPDGSFIRVTFVLVSEDRISTPIIKSYNVEWTCPNEGVD